MLDIKFIRENLELLKQAVKKKRLTVDMDRLVEVDEKRKELQQAYETVRAQQNEASATIATCKDSHERERLIAEMKDVKETLQKNETALKEVVKEWQYLMLQVPNIPDMSVPDGDDDASNKEVRVCGTIPNFSFTPKGHLF
jgi:seryl-tRNA synthetase